MATEEILIHQMLHGYSDGHSLLATSKRLSKEAERTLLLLSDMSGPSMVHGFEEYLTGFPLENSSVYALGRTWYAPEMKRPGCVWTHTLLIAKNDLTRIPDLGIFLKLFRRPKNTKAKKLYNAPILISSYELDIPMNRSGDFLESLPLVLALYSESGKPVFIAADDVKEYENLSLAIWSQQWPSLRYSFCFSTGSIANRQVGGKVFDLQVVPWKSIRNIKRKVPSGIFLDFDDSLFIQNTPRWATVVAKDISSLSPHRSLRKFLWDFGEEQQGNRGAFSKLVETKVNIDAVNNRDISLQRLVEAIANRFPAPEEATHLKIAVFDSKDRLLEISEGTLLRELLKTKHYPAFDAECLRIQSRARYFWQTSSSAAMELTLELLDSDLNPLGEEYIIGLAKSVELSDAVEVSKTNRDLLYIFVKHNPVLAGVSQVWQVPIDEQRELLDSVLSTVDLGTGTIRDIVVAILESGSDSIADEVVSNFGDVALTTVLDWINSYPGTSLRAIGESWKRALTSQPLQLLDWIQGPTIKTERGMAFVASLLNPNSSQVARVGAEVWLPLARNAPSQLEGKMLIKTMSFLLTLGFNNPGDKSWELVEHSFQIVHDGAQNEILDYYSWRLVRKHVPDLGWLRDWDKCERLRRALVQNFIRHKWSPESFLRSIKSPETFERVVKYCQKTRGNRAFLQRVAKQVANGNIQASVYQKKTLSRY
jgi:hypothetical protein